MTISRGIIVQILVGALTTWEARYQFSFTPQCSCMVLGGQPGLAVCSLWKKSPTSTLLKEELQVKATGCCSEHNPAIMDSALVFPCRIRKTVPGSCTRRKGNSLLKINLSSLYLNAVENWNVSRKWVNRLSAGERAGPLPAPPFLLQEYKCVCKLSTRFPHALLHRRQADLPVSLMFPQSDRMWSL